MSPVAAQLERVKIDPNHQLYATLTVKVK